MYFNSDSDNQVEVCSTSLERASENIRWITIIIITTVLEAVAKVFITLTILSVD